MGKDADPGKRKQAERDRATTLEIPSRPPNAPLVTVERPVRPGAEPAETKPAKKKAR